MSTVTPPPAAAAAPKDDAASSSTLLPPTTTSSSTAPLPHDDSKLTDDDIDSLIASLSPTSELDHLRAIEKRIRETQTRRRQADEEARAKIHALESALSELRRQSTRQAADWRSLAAHVETVEKLDNRNFDLAKKINEQESVLSGLQAQVGELKRSVEECDEVDVEDEAELDRDAYVYTLTKPLCREKSLTLLLPL